MIIEIDGHKFDARFEEQNSPETCASFKKAMPFESQVVHVRWSGEGMWIPLGDRDFGVGYEDATSHPTPGQIILYPKGKSETEILIAYGSVSFASKAGALAGNHFATITSDLDKLREIGMSTMWEGAKSIKFIAE
ncbi:DUF3830 family protein [Paraneptunicella aestuarii]|uniref:DUF3830 family protein n=1 Tax=Paraneptunicella aestuarii TaxID=2831148 RepID=UPI001E296F70|nr:DUF3830 family protein [Paraneptunicella aestuarii]UAA38679.1 DUF3830 family protein [Paraneptunicella aestuarii]